MLKRCWTKSIWHIWQFISLIINVHARLKMKPVQGYFWNFRSQALEWRQQHCSTTFNQSPRRKPPAPWSLVLARGWRSSSSWLQNISTSLYFQVQSFLLAAISPYLASLLSQVKRARKLPSFDLVYFLPGRQLPQHLPPLLFLPPLLPHHLPGQRAGLWGGAAEAGFSPWHPQEKEKWNQAQYIWGWASPSNWLCKEKEERA